MKSIFYIGIALLLDFFIADPYSWPHPVKIMGNYIYWFQNKFVRQDYCSKKMRFLGLILWLTTVALSGLVTYVLLLIAYKINIYIGALVYVYLGYTTLSIKGLANEGKKVYDSLINKTLSESRRQVGMIVGRDTSQLTRKEIINATIETIAENTSDGGIAPLMYLFIGGPILAMVYKAINTLDSMVGYTTPKYIDLGFISAKVDDFANYIPARLTLIFMICASYIMKLDYKNCARIGFRDCRKHKSPNSGYPEAAAAGVLGIQLGGSHVYHGVEIYKPYIGDDIRNVESSDILKTNKILYLSVIISFFIFGLLKTMIIMINCFI